MSSRGEVLVVIMNSREDWAIACEQHWYRIPLEQVEKLKHRDQWLPPKWLAFYQTKKFGEQDGCAIHCFAEVIGWQDVRRSHLFPEETTLTQPEKQYYKIQLGDIQRLATPIPSAKLRRITFIPTTWSKLTTAKEMSELMR